MNQETLNGDDRSLLPETLLIIETSDGETYRGKTTRSTALRIANFILAAPEKAPYQRPSGEGTKTAAVGCGDSQSETASSSVATQPCPPNAPHEPHAKSL